MLATEANLLSLTGGLRLKVRIQHPKVHERTDRGGSYWFFRYWDDVQQADGTTKAITAITVTDPGFGYLSAPTVVVTGGGGSGGAGTAVLATGGVCDMPVGSEVDVAMLFRNSAVTP